MDVQTNGISIHYELEGPQDAPVVVLSHSLAANLRMWDSQMDSLLPKFQVLRYDIRGHGKTEFSKGAYTFELLANDLFSLLSRLKIDKSHFVGLSLGGMIGQTAALMDQDRFLSLSLCDTSSTTPREALPMWEERISIVQTSGMDSVVDPTIDRWFSPNFQKYQVPEVDKVKAMISSTPVDGYCGCSAAIMKLNLTSQLSQISIPTLVMVGENDPGTPVALHEVIQQEISGSNLFVIPNALHFCNIEQSDIFNRKLIEFLSSIP